MRRSRLPLQFLLALSVSACGPRHLPSPQFQEAFELYNRLYARSLDDAYGDPQMAQVADLLRQVAPSSSQAGEAQDLLAKVERGQADYRLRQKEVLADQNAATAPARWNGPPAPVVFAKPAGLQAEMPGPTLGMTRDDFLARFADCFELKGEYLQGERQGEAYQVRGDECAAHYKALVGSVVVLLDNRVSALVNESDLHRIVLDAGAPEVGPPVKVVSQVSPPGASSPTKLKYYPGAPQPEPPGDLPSTPAPVQP